MSAERWWHTIELPDGAVTGAAEVVAIDRPSYFQSKCRVRFEEAHARLGSSVRYEERDLFELGPCERPRES